LLYFKLCPRVLMRRVPLFLGIGTNFMIVSLLWLPFALGGEGLRAAGLFSFGACAGVHLDHRHSRL
jgi:hypothetical protein